MDLQDGRDIVIIVVGSLAILVLLAMLVFTVAIGIAARMLLGTVRSLITDDVKPVVDSAHQTVRTVRGTATFISETAVTPVVKVYGMAAGARRMVSVITGVTGRRSRPKDKE